MVERQEVEPIINGSHWSKRATLSAPAPHFGFAGKTKTSFAVSTSSCELNITATQASREAPADVSFLFALVVLLIRDRGT
jgi:hypothetical protein